MSPTDEPAAPPTSGRLAMDRTRLAYERTLLAWIRTAMSLITFGFTLYKAFQFLRTHGGEREVPSAHGPRIYGMAMIAIGLVALLLATAQHRASMKALRAAYGDELPLSVAAVVAVLIFALGVVSLALVILRA